MLIRWVENSDQERDSAVDLRHYRGAAYYLPVQQLATRQIRPVARALLRPC